MNPIILPMQCVFSTRSATDDQLNVITRELNEADIEYYERVGWKQFRDEDLIEKKLPEFRPKLYLNVKAPVVEIKGRRYEVQFLESEFDREDPSDPHGKQLILTPTDEPLSKPGRGGKGYGRSYYEFFGQPRWVQGEHFPLDLSGNPCYHFLTIENGWGDSGNYNILVGLDENDVPNVAYFEASCC